MAVLFGDVVSASMSEPSSPSPQRPHEAVLLRRGTRMLVRRIHYRDSSDDDCAPRSHYSWTEDEEAMDFEIDAFIDARDHYLSMCHAVEVAKSEHLLQQLGEGSRWWLRDQYCPLSVGAFGYPPLAVSAVGPCNRIRARGDLPSIDARYLASCRAWAHRSSLAILDCLGDVTWGFALATILYGHFVGFIAENLRVVSEGGVAARPARRRRLV